MRLIFLTIKLIILSIRWLIGTILLRIFYWLGYAAIPVAFILIAMSIHALLFYAVM